MQTRIIYTNFWLNGAEDDLDLYGQHLYMYLLSSPHMGICSVFKLPDKYICLEAKLSPSELSSAKEQLAQIDKARFYKGWIYVVRAEQFVNYKNSPDNMKKYLKEVSLIPQDVMTNLSYIVDTTVYSTNKSGIINNKPLILTNRETEQVNNSVPF